MTRGRELPVNSMVRRRLFSEDEPTKPTWNGQDYLSRITKTEYIARNLKNEVILKGMKWNFDFVNEVPISGRINWYRKGNTGEWVGMQASGRTINMRKRDRDPNSATKSVYADERSKVRRLSPYSVMQRREFFNDGRTLENAVIQGEDDNFTNTFLEASPPVNREGIHWNFDYDNRVPLDGPVEWQLIGEDWVGHRPGLPSSIIIFPTTSGRPYNTDKIGRDSSSEGEMSDSDTSSDFTEDDTSSDDEKYNQAKLSKKKVDETEEGDEMEKRDEVDEEYIMEKEDENIIEVNDALHNVIIKNVAVTTDDSDMVKDLKKEINELGNDEYENKPLSTLPDDKFENLKITENYNIDMDEQEFKEKANEMKNLNEITPRSEREERTVPMSPEKISESNPRALNAKIKKRLYSQDFY